MTQYYIIKDNQIALWMEDKELLTEALIAYPDLQGLDILATDENQVIVDNELMTIEEAEEKSQKKEQERINNLTMTALDLIGVLRGFGLTLEQINDYLESNLEIKMQLTYCQNVYCGVVKSLMPITIGDITITADMIEQVFRGK